MNKNSNTVLFFENTLTAQRRKAQYKYWSIQQMFPRISYYILKSWLSGLIQFVSLSFWLELGLHPCLQCPVSYIRQWTKIQRAFLLNLYFTYLHPQKLDYLHSHLIVWQRIKFLITWWVSVFDVRQIKWSGQRGLNLRYWLNSHQRPSLIGIEREK